MSGTLSHLSSRAVGGNTWRLQPTLSYLDSTMRDEFGAQTINCALHKHNRIHLPCFLFRQFL